MARKTIYTSALALAAFLSGCQSDEPFKWNDREVPDTQTVLAFATEGFSQSNLQTRSVSPDREMPLELTLLQFNTTADGSGELINRRPYAVSEFTNKDGIYSKLVNRSELTPGSTAYLVANAKDMITRLGDSFTESAFRSIAIDNGLLLDEKVNVPLVSQPIELTDEMLNNDGKVDMFSLSRPYTRVSLRFDSSTRNFLTTGFALWQKPATSTLCSEGETKLGMTLGTHHQLIESPLNGEWSISGGSLQYLKEGERLTTDILPIAKDGNPLLIVRGYIGSFDDESNEYKFDNSEKENYYAVKLNTDLKPNTHYIITVTGVTAVGKTSAEEAAKAPASIAVQITEETPAINSIVTDGENVLAVQDNPVITAEGNGTLTILVRSNKEITTGNLADMVSIEGEAAWLHMSDWSTNATIEGVAASDAESMNGLVTQKITVPLKANRNQGLEREAALTVSLKNGDNPLKRQVTVTQQQQADASLADIFDIKLTITRGSETLLAETDYLKFIGATTGGTTVCQGLQPEDNGGRRRNAGLHRPMPNGDVTYKYHISLKSGSGTPTWPSGVSATGNSTSGWDVTLRSGTTDYDNESWPEGIKFDLGTFYINLDLYHTGFFNNENSTWRYYEVITVDGKHWLDRNIGASSAGMMEAGEDLGNTWPAREGSGGGWYNNTKATAPLPEGWVVPTVSDVIGLTQGSSFRHSIESGNGHRFFAPSCRYSYEEDGETLYASSYFPHNGIYNSGSTDGQPKTGYYLTSTNAGKEGWYQIVLMSGNEVVRQNLSLSDGTADRRASLRAIAEGSSGTSSAKNYTCSAKGYTHVFLYNENADGSRTTVNAWPGEQVAMYSTADSRFYQYELTSYANYRNLKVIFNKVNATTGKIEESSAVREGTVSGINELTPNTPGIAFKNGGAYCHCTTGGWITEGHVCGSTPGPDPEYTYSLKGPAFTDWNTLVPMSQNGNVWTWEGTPKSGDFGIARCNKNGEQVAWIWSSNKSGETISGAGVFPCTVENNSNGKNWTNQITSKATFIFDPDAMTLTITTNQTTVPNYYVFMWSTSYNKSRLHLWDNSNTYINRQSDSGVGKSSGSYYYICIKSETLGGVPSIGNGWYFNFCSGTTDWDTPIMQFNSTNVEESSNAVPETIKTQFGVSGNPIKVFLLKK